MWTIRSLSVRAGMGLLAASVVASSASAIAWNNDPAHGVTSSSGLTNKTGYFPNVHNIYNGTNSSRGTATYLANNWVLTARHVVQNGSNYGALASPGSISMANGSASHIADQILTPDGGSDIALVHLVGTVTGNTNFSSSIINTSFSETNKLVQVGGSGIWGYFGGSMTNSTVFHRGYNIAWVNNGQVKIIADGESRLNTLGLLEATAQSGDSGSAMWLNLGTDAQVNTWGSNYVLAGVCATSTGSAWGGTSAYTRVASYSSWITSTVWGSSLTLAAIPEPTTAALSFPFLALLLRRAR